jgi:hypothetical protein
MKISRRHRAQSGQGLGTNLTILAILVVTVVLIWRGGVPLFRKLLLDQQIERLVNWDRENQRHPMEDEAMGEILLTKARNYGFRAERKGIKFYYDPDAMKLTIKMDYVVPMDFFLFDFDWNVHVEKTTEPM